MAGYWYKQGHARKWRLCGHDRVDQIGSQNDAPFDAHILAAVKAFHSLDRDLDLYFGLNRKSLGDLHDDTETICLNSSHFVNDPSHHFVEMT